MKKIKNVLLSLVLTGSWGMMHNVQATKQATVQDISGDTGDTLYDISCDVDVNRDKTPDKTRNKTPEGYSAGYAYTAAATESECGSYDNDTLDDIFLPVDDGYVYTQPDVEPPSRIAVFFASLGIEVLFAYCKVKAWFAKYCCCQSSQDLCSQDLSRDVI